MQAFFFEILNFFRLPYGLSVFSALNPLIYKGFHSRIILSNPIDFFRFLCKTGAKTADFSYFYASGRKRRGFSRFFPFSPVPAVLRAQKQRSAPPVRPAFRSVTQGARRHRSGTFTAIYAQRKILLAIPQKVCYHYKTY